MRFDLMVIGALLVAGCGSDQRELAANGAGSVQAAQGGSGMGGGGMGGGGIGGGQLAMLGKMIFFDSNLSDPRGQSCASCHAPETGFSGASSSVNATTAVYPGAASTSANPRFGARKPPSAAYATPSPKLQYDAGEDLFYGGLFFDGRATGWSFDSPAAEQALGPFLNPVEQNLASKAEVVRRVCSAMYAQMFRMQFGEASCLPENVGAAFEDVGRAVAAFEASPFVNRYSSRYDRYLRGEATLTSLELEGLALFKDVSENGARCALCHPADLGPGGEPPLFTDNTFDNLGLPRNPKNPVYSTEGVAWQDLGLGGFLVTLAASPHPEYVPRAAANRGKHRVPTLRNVDKRPYASFVKSYGHNGVFKSLKDIVHFYNTRDTLPCCENVRRPRQGVNCWPPPEVAENVNREEIGNLGLTPVQEDAVVAFLRTLSDG